MYFKILAKVVLVKPCMQKQQLAQLRRCQMSIGKLQSCYFFHSNRGIEHACNEFRNHLGISNVTIVLVSAQIN
jgi:hypothetical protein